MWTCDLCLRADDSGEVFPEQRRPLFLTGKDLQETRALSVGRVFGLGLSERCSISIKGKGKEGQS